MKRRLIYISVRSVLYFGLDLQLADLIFILKMHILLFIHSQDEPQVREMEQTDEVTYILKIQNNETEKKKKSSHGEHFTFRKYRLKKLLLLLY